MRSTFFLGITFSLLFSFTSLFGQAASKVEFACASWETLPYKELFFASDGEPQPLSIPIGGLSVVHTLKKVNSFKIYTKITNEEGEVVFQQLGEKPLISGSKRMLFLVSRAAKDARWPLEIFALEDSVSSFPAGSFRFLNFSKDKLVVTFNNKSTRIAPEGISIVDSNVGKGGGFLPFRIDYQGNKVFGTKLYSQERSRETVLIGPPRKGQKVYSIKFLTDVVPPPPKPN